MRFADDAAHHVTRCASLREARLPSAATAALCLDSGGPLSRHGRSSGCPQTGGMRAPALPTPQNLMRAPVMTMSMSSSGILTPSPSRVSSSYLL